MAADHDTPPHGDGRRMNSMHAGGDGLSRRRMVVALTALLGLGVGGAAQANVPFWGERESRPVATPVRDLKPGQWVWAPGVAPAGPILMVVNLDQQLAYAYRNGLLIGYATASTGKKGHETPTGIFHTLQKDKNHRSSKYNNAPMPYTQRLTWDGVALHAGGLPGYPSSHGCVHLPSAFAEALFAASPMGMTVVVARRESAPLDLQHPLPITPVDPRTGTVEHEPRLAGDAAFRWQPDNAPAGPVSLVLSAADERLLVLRAGIEIGRAKVSIADAGTPFGTHAFVLKAPMAGEAATAPVRWSGVAVPGHADDAGRPIDPAQFARVRLPPDFLKVLVPALTEGTVLVVTDAPVLEQTTGSSMTVVTNQPPEA